MVLRQNRTIIGLLLIGLSLFLFGLIMSQFWEGLVLTRFYRERSLQPDSIGFKEWQYTKNPIKTSFYFWNWTNPEEVEDENIKPHFVEMGPYVFWQTRRKVDLVHNIENGTVTYRNKFIFYFDSHLSNGSLNDEVTSINTIAAVSKKNGTEHLDSKFAYFFEIIGTSIFEVNQSAAYMTRTWSKFFLYPLSIFLRSSGQKIWWTKNVSQLLFEGIENPVQKIRSHIPGYDGPDRFGYFYDMNNTVQPSFINIDSGMNDINKIGQIYYLVYKNETDIYPNCKEIKGSNGEFFPPFLTPDRRLEMYVPRMCRRMFHYYTGESTYEGLKTYVYSATKQTFDDGGIVPENKCYCVEDVCPKSGVFDISRCTKGAPIAYSLPHFLHADPYYRDVIDGMNPDETKHQFYLALEPVTAIQVNVSGKLQINVRLSRNPGLSQYRNVPDIYIPVFWQESELLAAGEYLSKIRLLVFILQYGSHICYGTCGFGFVVIVLVIIHQLYNQNSLKKKQWNSTKKIKGEKKIEKQKLNNVDENEKECDKYVKPILD